MRLYMSHITKDMTWAKANGIHMGLVMVLAMDDPVTWKTNGMLTNSQAVEAFFKSLSGSNTVLVKRLYKFIGSYDGVPEGPQGTFQPPQTPKTRDDCRSSLQAYLMEQLPSSIMVSNPGDKKFPWGQLPFKLLQASCSLVQWLDGKMFDF